MKALVAILALGVQPALADLRVSGPNPLDFVAFGQFCIFESAGENVKFQYSGVTTLPPNVPNFIVVSPTSGTTPGCVEITINPAIVAATFAPGQIATLRVSFTTVGETPPSTAVGILNFRAAFVQLASVQAVVNTASVQPFLSPGAMVSIFGSSLAAPRLFANFDDTGRYPTSLGGTTVTFNGVPAPLLYVSETQINAVVPFSLAGQSSAEVVVNHLLRPSPAFRVPLHQTSPAIFTASQTGSGQAAIRQAGPGGVFTYNSAENPASRGTAFELFSTGAGAWDLPYPTDIAFGSRGSLGFGAHPFTAQPVSLTIGGRPARIFYAGTSPYQVWGLLQVNAVVPDDVGSGPQPLVLRVGPNDSSQQTVTIAIQ